MTRRSSSARALITDCIGKAAVCKKVERVLSRIIAQLQPARIQMPSECAHAVAIQKRFCKLTTTTTMTMTTMTNIGVCRHQSGRQAPMTMCLNARKAKLQKATDERRDRSVQVFCAHVNLGLRECRLKVV